MPFPDFVPYGNALNPWLIAAVITIGAFLGFKLLNTLLIRRFDALARRPRTAMAGAVAGDVLRRTSSLFLLIAAVYIGARFLGLPEDTLGVVDTVAFVALLIQVGLWSNVAITRFLEREVEKRLESDAAAATMLSFARVFIIVAVWLLLLVVAIQNLGYDVAALVAGLGIGGIAIAFAVQGVLSDLFASISIVMDKPFAVGDFVIAGQTTGTVEHVGLSSTRIRSLSGEQISVPNSDLVNSRVHNYKRMAERRVVFRIGVVYDTPHAKLRAIPALVREIVEAQEKTRFDRAHFQALGDFSLNYEIVYFVLDPDYNLYMDVQQAINLELFRRFEEEGIEFAFPTQMLYMQQQDRPVSTMEPAAASADSRTDITTRE